MVPRIRFDLMDDKDKDDEESMPNIATARNVEIELLDTPRERW